MEVYIIRHTRVAVAKGICYGQTDVALCDTFQEEANQLKKQLPSQFNAVYASPLSRCKQLAASFSSEIIFDNRLKEMDFGNWELKDWNDIPLDEIEPWYADFVTIPATNGESFQQLFNRCASFLEELRKQNLSRVLVVTHSGIIRCIWAYLLQIPLQNAFKVPVDFGEILHIHLGNHPHEDTIVSKK